MIEDDPLWYKDAIIYELHVKAFFDSTNDGKGDFRGLADKLDYLHDLGVNTLWLLPFYPSPQRDDGYDISDYQNVHPDFGSLADFRHFIRAAHQRGLRIITELVINHTSDQHAWFQAARQAPPGSRKRDFYIWNDDDKKFPETRIIFSDSETSNWAWDPVAKAYYWHRFFSHQPDLNHNNPQVIEALLRVMRFWFDLGVDGMRLDAIPYLCVREGTHNENLPETHAVIKHMRAELDKRYRNRMLLAEANQWPEDVREYFGAGDECHMAYHFPLMPRIYMAIAQEDRHPIVEIIKQTPDIPDNCQWAIFLRNHDELTLEMVTDRERDYMYQMYAADPGMRLNAGIRRRLAPLMDNNRDKIELINSLLLSMPGSPIIYYGDEIGMGDNMFLGDRNGVRTPMQWSPDRNAGFSRADPERLYLPPIMDAVYGYPSVNVEAQSRSPGSLLAWTKRLIAVRNAFRAFGRGSLDFLHPGNRKILAYLRSYADDTIFCVVNLSRYAQPVELNLAAYKGRVPVELMGRTRFPPIGDLPYLLTLPGYGFYWFNLTTHVDVPAWHEEHAPLMELPVLVLPDGWHTFITRVVGVTEPRRITAGQALKQLEQEVLPVFLTTQRWFAEKGQTITRAELSELGEWRTSTGDWLFTLLKIHSASDLAPLYAMPLAIAWEDSGEERIRNLLHATLAKVRQRARVGILFDALADDDFCQSLLTALRSQQTVPLTDGELQFVQTGAFTTLVDEQIYPVRHPPLEQSNTNVFFGDKLVLKAYRKLQEGINPELEMGRFLTDVVSFKQIAPLAGAIEYRRPSGVTITLAILQGYVHNQGTGWSYTVDYLERFLEGYNLATTTPSESVVAQPHSVYLALIDILGTRTGELHNALAQTTGDPAFDPEPVAAQELAAWCAQIQQDIEVSLDQLQARHATLPPNLHTAIDSLWNARARLHAKVEALAALRLQTFKTRYHGDYHLGQVLLAQNDFVIIDFEGEPARPLVERRSKHSPLRDVAGMLRSFHYAAQVALLQSTAERPDDQPVFAPMLREWVHQTTTTFLAGYQRALDVVLPATEVHPTVALLELFVMEKALYELRYELNNRPDWVAIPMAGLLEIVDAPGAAGATP